MASTQLELVVVDLHVADVGGDAEQQYHRQQHQRQRGGVGSKAGGVGQQGQRDDRGRPAG
jgi:hypothetical protein